MFYPATFTLEENGGYTVSFRDIPEALTCGDNLDDAKEMAQDALITAMDFILKIVVVYLCLVNHEKAKS